MSSKFLDKTGLDTLWAKIKSTFQTLGNLVTAWGSTPSDTKYPSEKLVKTSLDEISTNTRTIPQDVSKGANLVVNGSGRMASNYNFTSFLYVPTISYGGSAGSFGYNDTGAENEYISCDFNKKVVFSADVKNLVTQSSNCIHRVYVLEFDIDKKSINAIHVMYGVGTLTELTQDLNPGDTVVHLADLSNANWLSATTYHRGFIFWNYQNSYGYLYPPETYSRNVYPSGNSNPLWDVANVNVSAGTITLNSGWTGPAIPAGTKVSRRSSGNTYPYPTSVTTGDTEWHSMKGYMRGVASPGTSERSSTKFSQGTAFIRAGIYPSNLNNTDPVINKRAVVANFAIYEEQDINDGFGTLPVNRGGTGKTSVTAGNYLVGNGTNALTEKTPNVAANDLINALTTGESTPTDNDYYVAQYAGGGTTTKTFHRRPVKALWEYIKGKISSVLDLTATSYGGNAATATTAAGYTSGGAIDTALQGKQDTLTDLATIRSGASAGATAVQPGDLGSAAYKDVPESGDAGPEQVVLGSDSRLSSAVFLLPQGAVTNEMYGDIVNAASGGKIVVLQLSSGGSASSYLLTTITSAGEILASRSVEDTIYSLSISPVSGSHTVTTTSNQLVSQNDRRLTRSVWSGGGTAVCGYKICTTAQIAGRPGQTVNVYAIVMGTMCLTNKYAVEPQGGDSTGKDGALAMGSFMVWCEGKADGSITARARLFSSDAAFNNTDLALCKKYVNGSIEWFVAFGPWTSSKAVTSSRSFGMSVSYDYVQNVSVPDELESIPSGYGYEDYYTVWKHPYMLADATGVGSTTRPVYVTANGQVKQCNRLVEPVTTIDTSTMVAEVLYVM